MLPYAQCTYPYFITLVKVAYHSRTVNVLLSTEPQAAGGQPFGSFNINRSSEPGQTGPSSSATEHADHWNTNHRPAREPLCVSYTTTTPSAPQVQREMSRKDFNSLHGTSPVVQLNMSGMTICYDLIADNDRLTCF